MKLTRKQQREIERLVQLVGPCQTDLLGPRTSLVSGREFVSQYRQFFVEEVLAGVRQTYSGPAVLVDCGANVGTVAAWFRAQFPWSRVVAVEGDPEVLPHLERNTRGYESVEIVDALAWTSDGFLDLLSDGRCGSHIADGRPDVGFRAARVRTVDIRRLLNEHVTLLKVDVEGAERQLLPHAQAELTANVDYIHVEVHETVNAPRMLGSLIGLLTSCGFHLHVAPLHMDPQPFRRVESWNSIVNPMAVYGWKDGLGPDVVETIAD